MLHIAKRIRVVNKRWAALAAAAVAVLSLLIFVDVMLRLFLNRPIMGAYEISQQLLGISIFAGFAFLQSDKGHVSVTMLINKLPEKVRNALLFVEYLIAVIFVFLIGVAAWQQGLAYIQTGSHTAILLIPYHPFYFFESVSMILFAITLLIDGVILGASLFNKVLAAEVATWEAGSTD
jgi:TRAP-type C4-dicarboxylate transport system permease small subunit